MKFPENEIVVLDIAGERALVGGGESSDTNALLALGFNPEGAYFVRKIVDDEDRRNIIYKLVEMSALFSSGRDWSPAELMDLYREQGAVTTSYRVIAWHTPENYVITTY
ncbi:hypothetical protein [Duganella radicis]|uniref:Uncharacterized protein n=1 Tax=Duganella radicis TaxID=551988 RepID=A0A6L6PQT4_9BURK|nr:hypothetical protein [Duganella radicis]MTV41476.1 hypothetical protein [Duganella radicis]